MQISRFSAKVLITVGIVIVFFVIMSLLFNIPHLLLLLFISIIIAVFLDGTASFLNRRINLSHSWGIFAVAMLLILITFISSYVLGPPVLEQMSKLASSLPKAIQSVETDLKKSEVGRMLISGLPNMKKDGGEKSLDLFTGIFSSVLGSILDLLLVIVLGIYLAINPRLYINNFILLFPPKKRERAQEVFFQIGHALRLWLLGRGIIMISVGILTAAGLYIIGMPLPIALGLITGVLAFVPYLGAFAAYVPVLLIGLSESLSMGFYATIVYIVLHNIEGYILTPIIQERMVSIPPGFLIIMQILMFILFGPLGVLIATPLGVVGIILVQTIYIEDILGDKVKILGDKIYIE